MVTNATYCLMAKCIFGRKSRYGNIWNRCLLIFASVWPIIIALTSLCPRFSPCLNETLIPLGNNVRLVVSFLEKVPQFSSIISFIGILLLYLHGKVILVLLLLLRLASLYRVSSRSNGFHVW